MTSAERDEHAIWCVKVLRTYGVEEYRCVQIAEALLDDGLVSEEIVAARLAALTAEVAYRITATQMPEGHKQQVFGILRDVFRVNRVIPPDGSEDDYALLRQMDEAFGMTGRCRHCGKFPDADGDHSCPCPYPDDTCPDHPRLEE